MNKLIINGSLIEGKSQLHDLIAEKLQFPDYYGKNLDALFDCLTDLTDETCIEITNAGLLSEMLGDYADRLIQTFSEASEINRMIEFNCID